MRRKKVTLKNQTTEILLQKILQKKTFGSKKHVLKCLTEKNISAEKSFGKEPDIKKYAEKIDVEESDSDSLMITAKALKNSMPKSYRYNFNDKVPRQIHLRQDSDCENINVKKNDNYWLTQNVFHVKLTK